MKKIIIVVILVLLVNLAACINPVQQTEYTVIFDSCGGSAVASQTVAKGGYVARPTVVHDSYSLNGWYTSPVASQGRAWNFDTDRVSADITLYAVWSTTTAEKQMYITINGTKLEVTLSQNTSVDALLELLNQEDITYVAHHYGGFEIVGNIGQSLPTNNMQITAQVGDVMLYQGNSIVIFYGQNSWSYTSIGKINGYSASELRALLGTSGSVEVRLSK